MTDMKDAMETTLHEFLWDTLKRMIEEDSTMMDFDANFTLGDGTVISTTFQIELVKAEAHAISDPEEQSNAE